MSFHPAGSITGIGSLPHRGAAEAVEWVFRNTPDLPFWPQLPASPGGRDMVGQFQTGFPGLVNPAGPPLVNNDSAGFREGCERLGADLAAGNLDPYGFTPDEAPGWFAFVARFSGAGRTTRFVKGQVTGPATLSTSFANKNRVSMFVTADAFEAAVQWVTLKGLWQIRELLRLGATPVLFLDEPILDPVLGGYSRTAEERGLAGLRRVLASWRAAGAVAGLHVCPQVRWKPLFELGADVLSFDAAQYLEDFLQELDAVRNFFRAGGVVAWGVIPTHSPTCELEPTAARRQLDDALGRIADPTLAREQLLRQSLFTPACGTGGLELHRSEAVFQALKAVARSYVEAAEPLPALPH
ncbi:MAG: hypothetical protein HYZ53_14240 [Planctomycetes bacterium]|nr:hypothetical protein [Planctomycetota bacterium]